MSGDTKALRELLAKATPGPWRHDAGDTAVFATAPSKTGSRLLQTLVAGNAAPNDAALIVALHNAAPALLDEIDRLREVERAARVIRESGIVTDESFVALANAFVALDALRASSPSGGGR
jgi:hypothetical protein